MDQRIRLTVIRHLPTAGNKRREYIGWTDEPILASNEKNNKFPWQPSIVYGSDLLRCRESAALYFPQVVFKSDERLRESYFGEWEGKTYEQLKGNPLYRAWIEDPEKFSPPGGESLQEVKARVTQAIKALPNEESNYNVVTHGGPIRLLLTAYAPQQQDFWSWVIPHGTAWQFEWRTRADFKEGKRCESLSAVPTTGNAPM